MAGNNCFTKITNGQMTEEGHCEVTIFTLRERSVPKLCYQFREQMFIKYLMTSRRRFKEEFVSYVSYSGIPISF